MISKRFKTATERTVLSSRIDRIMLDLKNSYKQQVRFKLKLIYL